MIIKLIYQSGNNVGLVSQVGYSNVIGLFQTGINHAKLTQTGYQPVYGVENVMTIKQITDSSRNPDMNSIQATQTGLWQELLAKQNGEAIK